MANWRTAYDRDGDAKVFAGEVITLELALQQPGAPGAWEAQSMAGRTFVQRVTDKAGAVKLEALGEVLTVEGVPLARFTFTGAQTASLLTGSARTADLEYEVSEVLSGGRDVLVEAAFKVILGADPAAPLPPPSFPDPAPAARITVQQGARGRIVVRYIGAPGRPGEDGDPGGPPGPQGVQGPAGPQGAQGLQGPIGPKGDIGPAGNQGPIGAQGPQGNPGAQGPQGQQGAQGLQGPIGQTGPQGNPGPEGPEGAAGPEGPPGPQGEPGEQGPEGPEGPQGPQGAATTITGELDDEADLPAVGEVGQGYLIAGDLWVWIEPEAEWVNVGTVQGPAGIQGPAGPQGPPGPTGPQGAAGATGSQGIQGPAGAQGPAGIQGPEGPEGPAGVEGPQGPTGDTGPTGPQGPQGLVGPEGPEGPQGPAGADGADGASVADAVSYDDTLADISAAVGYPVTNVQQALEALYSIISSGGGAGGDGTFDFNTDAGNLLIPAFV